jgi:hypothetical protein
MPIPARPRSRTTRDRTLRFPRMVEGHSPHHVMETFESRFRYWVHDRRTLILRFHDLISAIAGH